MARNNELSVLGAAKITFNSVLLSTAAAAVAVKSGAESAMFAAEGMARSGARDLLLDGTDWTEEMISKVDGGQLKAALVADLMSSALQKPEAGSIMALKASIK